MTIEPKYENLSDLDVRTIQGLGMAINKNLRAATGEELPLNEIVRYFDEGYLEIVREGDVSKTYKATSRFEGLRKILQFGR